MNLYQKSFLRIKIGIFYVNCRWNNMVGMWKIYHSHPFSSSWKEWFYSQVSSWFSTTKTINRRPTISRKWRKTWDQTQNIVKNDPFTRLLNRIELVLNRFHWFDFHDFDIIRVNEVNGSFDDFILLKNTQAQPNVIYSMKVQSNVK